MAWSAPRTFVAGDLLTAAQMNQDVRDNSTILKVSLNNSGYLSLPDAAEKTISSGAISITTSFVTIDTEGDAASDDLATITAGTNVGSGHILTAFATNTARTVVLKDGTGNLDLDGADITLDSDEKGVVLIYTGSKWKALSQPVAAASVPVTGYAVTLANVAGTTAETSSMSFTVPADAMADGDVIWLRGTALVKNNSGSTSTFLTKLHWGSTSANINNGGNLVDDSTEAKWMVGVMLMREGNDIWVIDTQSASYSNVGPINIPNPVGHNAAAIENVAVLSSCTFDSGQTVALKVTFGVGNAATYFNAQTARATRYSET
jgi:hypothetical protein